MKIVLLDRATLGEDTPIECLSELGEVVSYQFSTPEEAHVRIKDADVIVINKLKVDRSLLESAEKLKLICIFATGYDSIDVFAAKEKEIGVCNVPAYSTDSVTLFTVSTVLALASHLVEYTDFVRSGEYTAGGMANRLTPVYHDIAGKTWGIVGYGNIGRSVGRVAEALGAKIIVNKRSPVDSAECVDIDTLCRRSDIITIHCPLNDSSRKLINSERISLMRENVILVNEARGAVLDEEAIADAVENGKIAAFGCDVYSTEPFGKDHPYNRIVHRKNVLLTPHAAWGSYEARERCIRIIAQNIKSFKEGKILNRVDK